ncbi:integrase, partial [Clostridium butyricum]
NSLIKKGKSVNSIKNLNKIIAPCIRYAFDNNIIIKDFSRSIVLPREKEEEKLAKVKKVQPFTLEEQKKFVKAIDGHDLEMLFLTALNTGLRQGELLALTWKDIDFKNNTIRVNKTVKYISDVSKEGRGACRMTKQTPKSESSKKNLVYTSTFDEEIKTVSINNKKELK